MVMEYYMFMMETGIIVLVSILGIYHFQWDKDLLSGATRITLQERLVVALFLLDARNFSHIPVTQVFQGRYTDGKKDGKLLIDYYECVVFCRKKPLVTLKLL